MFKGLQIPAEAVQRAAEIFENLFISCLRNKSFENPITGCFHRGNSHIAAFRYVEERFLET